MNTSTHENHDTEDIISVLAHYSLGTVQSISLASGGMTNDNWFITTGTGRYFLRRRHPFFSQASIDFELGLIDYLIAKGFPTAPVIRTRDGFVRVEAFGRNWELYKYIQGEPFDPANLSQVKSAAQLLARFHSTAAGYRGDIYIGARRVIDFNRAVRFIDIFDQELATNKEPTANRSSLGILGMLLAPYLISFFRRQAKLVRKGIMQLSSVPLVIVHGDFQPSNIIFHGNAAIALVDLGDSGLSYRAYDVAKAVLRFSDLRPDYDNQSDIFSFMDLKRAIAFIHAYQEKLPLSSQEINAIPALLRGAYLYDAGFFLWKQANPLNQALWLYKAWQFSGWIDKCAEAVREIFGAN